MRIVWLCAYPVDLLPRQKVQFNESKVFHPATWAFNLAKALSKKNNIELHIITETPCIKKTSRFEHDKIHFHVLKRPYSIPFINRGLPSFLMIDRLTKYYFDRRKFRAEIDRINPDLIHSHGTETRYAFIGSKMKKTSVVSMQGVVGYLKDIMPGKGWRLQEKIEIETIRDSTHFISRADFTDEYIRKYNTSAQIFRIDDVVADEFFLVERKPVEFRLFFAGSVTKSKGIEDLLTACELLVDTFEKIELRIAGNIKPSYKEDLLGKFNTRLNIDRIKFLGHLDRKEILAEYSLAEIFVFPSYFETSPNVIMEAMSVGLPIVSTFAGGIPDMITHKKSGLLVDPGSPKGIARQIVYLLENKEYARELGKNAMQSAEQRFKQDIVVKKTIELYEKILTT